MRTRDRYCFVEFLDPPEGRPGWLYELGIPVVETGDRFDVNIGQKVPLNMDRDNVTPAYLQAVRVVTLNATHDLLDAEECTQPWVRAATGDARTSDDAVRAAVHKRFGEDAVIFDPSDREANKISQAAGRQVVFGGSLSKEEWARVREAEVLKPAGVVTPSQGSRVEAAGQWAIPAHDWTDEMSDLVLFCQRLASRVLDGCERLDVLFIRRQQCGYEATFGRRGLGVGCLVFNLAHCHPLLWASPDRPTREILDLIVHEFGHWVESDHLSRAYYHACTRIAGDAIVLALEEPGLFKADSAFQAAAKNI